MQLADLGRLVEQHHGAVVAVAFATTRDLALAEDIAQETFIAAWDARDSLRDPERVRSWLCGIARNLSRNALRSRRREVGGVEDNAVSDREPNVLMAALDHERQRELRTALADVPEQYREPLVLFYWEDRSIAQVASALGLSEQAAQQRISRARKMLRAELEAPLESTGRARKSAAAAAAAVLAVLATRTGGVAHAATAKKGAAMSIVKGAGVLVVAGLVTGGVMLARDTSGASPKEIDRASQVERDRVAVPAPPELPGAGDSPGRPAGEHALGAARGALPVPADGYELTQVGPRSVSVELAGGKSGLFAVDTSTAPVVRRITGRVVGDGGKPIAGAVVIVGDSLRAYRGALHGDAGAKTDADGAFSIATHEDAAGYAIALHPAGWSNVAQFPAGRSDVTLSLRTPTSGTLAIAVTRGGAAREADVGLTMAGGGVRMSLQTDATGTLRVPLLAPDTYRIEVRPAHGYLGGTALGVTRDVAVVSDRETPVGIELPTGVTLAVSASKKDMATVEYFFYRGTETLPLAELKKRALDFLYGGVDADRPGVIHDVEPGTYTVCVEAVSDERRHPLACRRVDVTGETPTLDVVVDVK